MDEVIFENELRKVFDKGSSLRISGAGEFNACVYHVVSPIRGSAALFESGLFAMSISVLITVIEEVGKTHTALYLSLTNACCHEWARRDPLKDHKIKQIIGSNYTIGMGERLVDTIGHERLEEIYSLSQVGELKTMREEMLYWNQKDGKLIIPEELADCQFSRDLLLFAIESFDDNLVGYTDYSIRASRETDALFEKLSQLRAVDAGSSAWEA